MERLNILKGGMKGFLSKIWKGAPVITGLENFFFEYIIIEASIVLEQLGKQSS